MLDAKNQIAFVAGATGYTGGWVVKTLRELGVRTIAHIRPDSGKRDQYEKQFSTLGAETDSSAWTQEQMTRTLAELKPTLLFALLGTTQRRVKSAARSGDDPAAAGYQAVDYGLTSILIQAAARLENKPRLIYLSAVGVSEKSRTPYYRARARVQRELKESGLPYIIAQPSFITGPDRPEKRTGERFGAFALDASLSVIRLLGVKNIAERYRSINGQQLGQALTMLALDAKFVNRTFGTEELRHHGAVYQNN